MYGAKDTYITHCRNWSGQHRVHETGCLMPLQNIVQLLLKCINFWEQGLQMALDVKGEMQCAAGALADMTHCDLLD